MNRYRLWLIVIILIALSGRLYNLTYHSLWFDEAISVHWARQTVPRILEVGFTLVEDRLPPLYYLMLKGWGLLFGFGEASVRGLSVIFSVLLVPVVAGIGALLFNRRVALIAAGLSALNPFLIWYAQEARMYAPAVFYGTLMVWAFLKMGEASRSLIFFSLFTLAAIAGLYSHLYTGFLLPALGLWLIVSYPRDWRLWLLFGLGGLIITLAFAPIALAIWRFSAEAAPGNPVEGILQRAWWLLTSFTIWKAPLSRPLQIIIPVIILLFVTAAYFKPKQDHRQPATTPNLSSTLPSTSFRTGSTPLHPSSLIPHPSSLIPHPLLLITFLLIFPFLIANLLLLRNQLAFFGERYFIGMVPWLLLLAAVGADNLNQWMRIATNDQYSSEHRQPVTNTPSSTGDQYLTGHKHPNRAQTINDKGNSLPTLRSPLSAPRSSLSAFRASLPVLLLLIATALPLPGQWSIPAAKEAWRQSVAFLAKYATPADGILIHPDWVRYPFQYYFQGPGQTYAAFSDVTQETALDGPLQGVIDDHPVVWLIQSHLDAPDPDHRVEQWFATRYPLVTEVYPPGIRLKGYATNYQLKQLPPEATSSDIRFENGLRLVGYRTDTVASPTDSLFHPPSGWVHVILYWMAGPSITADATPIVQLVGPEGIWGVSLDRANDAFKLYPPSHWPAETENRIIIRQDLDVNLNPVTPPGTYPLWLGFQEDDTWYPLTEVEIRPE